MRAKLCSAAVLAAAAGATWPTLGGDWYHDSLVYASLPSPNTGFVVHAIMEALPGVSAAIIGTPLVGSDGTVVTVHANGLVRTLAPGSTAPQTSNCTAGDGVVAPPALNTQGDAVLLATVSGAAYSVSISSGACMWGPISVGMCAGVFAQGQDAWFLATQGTITIIDGSTGQIVTTTPQETCGGRPDGYSSTPALLPLGVSTCVCAHTHEDMPGQAPDNSACNCDEPQAAPSAATSPGTDSGAVAVLVTSRGCVRGVSASGVCMWAMDDAGNTSFAQPITAPVAVAAPSSTQAQAFFISGDGILCCVDLVLHARCVGWSVGVCIGLPNNAGFGGGLALSPPSTAFQGGQVFAVDTGGTEYAVLMQDSTIAMSAPSQLLLDGVVTTPVLVPGGLGQDLNILVIAAQTGNVYAVYVGDAPTSTDDTDDSTDDQYGNAGVAWSLNIFVNVTAPHRFQRRLCALLRGCSLSPVADASSVSATGFVVQGDGSIIIGASDGSVTAIRPAHAAPVAASDLMIALVVTGAGLGILLCIVLVMYCAWQRRRTLRQMRRDEAVSISAALLDKSVVEDSARDWRPGAESATSLESLAHEPARGAMVSTASSSRAAAGWMPPKAPMGTVSLRPVRSHHQMNTGSLN